MTQRVEQDEEQIVAMAVAAAAAYDPLEGRASAARRRRQDTLELLDNLEGETRRFRKRHRLFLGLGVPAYLLFMLIAHFTFWTGGARAHPLIARWLLPCLFMVFLAGLLGGAWNWFLGSTRAAKRMVQRGKGEDLRAVGPLLGALDLPAGQEAVRGALIRLLPRLKASDAGMLTASRRASLYRALRRYARTPVHSYYEHDFVVAVLKALEQVGDAEDIPSVRWLAGAAKDQRVQQAARECLPFLQERTERERRHQRLLRPSTSPEQPQHSLLRSAQAFPPSDRHVLLRPAPDMPPRDEAP